VVKHNMLIVAYTRSWKSHSYCGVISLTSRTSTCKNQRVCYVWRVFVSRRKRLPAFLWTWCVKS